MTTLLEIRQKIISFFSQYETYIEPAVKFVVILLALVHINHLVGYQDTLAGTVPTIIIALVCTLIPVNAAAAIVALILLVHLYTLALEAAIVGGILFLVLLLLYYRFSPRDSILLFLYPLFQTIGIPYVLPIAGGLLYAPGSGVTIAVGVVTEQFLQFVHANETAITSAASGNSSGSSGLDTDSLVTNFRFLVDGIVQDRDMLILVIAVIAATVLVYGVRRLPVRYSWTLAAGIGAIVQLIVLLAGAIAYDTDIRVGASFVGIIVSFLIGVGISFFAFNLDYTRIENTQFEDDDYYYYVKAVPKNVLPHQRRKVTTINTRGRDEERARGRRGTAERYYSADDGEWNTGRADSAPRDFEDTVDAYGEYSDRSPEYENVNPEDTGYSDDY